MGWKRPLGVGMRRHPPEAPIIWYSNSRCVQGSCDVLLAEISVLPVAFLLYFALLWFGVTTLLGFLSGWYSLMRRYPDRPEAALLTLESQSGSLGGVGIRGALRLSVCASGLRIGLMRLLGPFCRDFLVPWQSISITRKDRVLWRTATLDLGSGRLRLPSEVADRLARVAGNHWPEPGPFPEEADGAVRSRLLKQTFRMNALWSNRYRWVSMNRRWFFSGVWALLGAPAAIVLVGYSEQALYTNLPNSLAFLYIGAFLPGLFLGLGLLALLSLVKPDWPWRAILAATYGSVMYLLAETFGNPVLLTHAARVVSK